MAVKDLLAIAGQPLGAGSAVRDDAPSEDRDASIVGQLRGAGAIVIGRAALHEFAYGVTGVNEHTGSPVNPHDPRRVPGGSSSGSAVAVAEGSAIVAVGTDTGGSIRIPAALCGVVGFKPARGTYSLDGVFPLAPSLDHVGLLARTVDDVVAVHSALGHAPPTGGPVRALGTVPVELEEADGDVRGPVERVMDALRTAGVAIGPVRWPGPDRSFSTSTAIMYSEASAVHRRTLEHRSERYSAEVRQRLEAGFEIDAPTYVAAKREQVTLRREVLDVLGEVDAVVTPTVPTVAPPLGAAHDPDTAALLVRNTRLANVVGVPALSLPLHSDGLPVGLQIVARDDPTVLRVAEAIERAVIEGCLPAAGREGR